MSAEVSPLLLLAALAASALSACAPAEPIRLDPPPDRPTPAVDPLATPDAARDLPLTELASGQHAPMGLGEGVYRDAEAWAAVRERLDPLAAEPDFPLEAVLVAAVDARTGGYRVRFDRVYTERDAPEGDSPAVAVYVVEEPGEGCMVTMALTRPYAVVAVAGLPRGPVRFVERREPYPCE